MSLPLPISRALLAAALLATAGGAGADFTLLGRSTLTAMNMANTGKESLLVKKQRLRRDLTDRGRLYTFLYDLASKELTVVDHLLRQAETHSLNNARKAPAVKDLRLELAGTGRRHTLQDWNCEEYGLEAEMPGEMGQEKVKVLLSGRVWLERQASERKELAPFLKAVAAEDFFMGAAMPGKPLSSQAQGINEAIRRVLDKGMLCAAEIDIKYEGGGPMADLGRRMATRMSIIYEALSDQNLPDALFEIPAGYRVVRR